LKKKGMAPETNSEGLTGQRESLPLLGDANIRIKVGSQINEEGGGKKKEGPRSRSGGALTE